MASRKRLRDWGSPAGRAAEITRAVSADPDPSRKAPGRKNTRDWCKGKEGHAHQPEIVFRPPWTRKPVTCKWDTRWVEDAVRWRCHHEEHCARCGKILRITLKPAECPAYPGADEQRAEAVAQASASALRWAEWRRRQRWPVITGPQGYRRKREKEEKT